jgi:hypothetical protein
MDKQHLSLVNQKGKISFRTILPPSPKSIKPNIKTLGLLKSNRKDDTNFPIINNFHLGKETKRHYKIRGNKIFPDMVPVSDKNLENIKEENIIVDDEFDESKFDLIKTEIIKLEDIENSESSKKAIIKTEIFEHPYSERTQVIYNTDKNSSDLDDLRNEDEDNSKDEESKVDDEESKVDDEESKDDDDDKDNSKDDDDDEDNSKNDKVTVEKRKEWFTLIEDDNYPNFDTVNENQGIEIIDNCISETKRSFLEKKPLSVAAQVAEEAILHNKMINTDTDLLLRASKNLMKEINEEIKKDITCKPLIRETEKHTHEEINNCDHHAIKTYFNNNGEDYKELTSNQQKLLKQQQELIHSLDKIVKQQKKRIKNNQK